MRPFSRKVRDGLHPAAGQVHPADPASVEHGERVYPARRDVHQAIDGGGGRGHEPHRLRGDPGRQCIVDPVEDLPHASILHPPRGHPDAPQSGTYSHGRRSVHNLIWPPIHQRRYVSRFDATHLRSSVSWSHANTSSRSTGGDSSANWSPLPASAKKSSGSKGM